MRAIILAAGKGNRLGQYARDYPKCLLEVGGISLLERQIATFQRLGVNDIVVVKGFAADKINTAGVRYHVVQEYWHNMVFSLFCAEAEIDGEVIISYADILFEDSVLGALLDASPAEVLVVADTLWEEYYRERSDKPLEMAESFIYDSDRRILEIGEGHPDPADVQAQYIGLIRLSDNGSMVFRQTYHRAREQYWDKLWIRGRVFQKIYMTDFLQALIDEGVPVYAVLVKHGWLEFDTATDYERVLEWHASGTLDRFCSLQR